MKEWGVATSAEQHCRVDVYIDIIIMHWLPMPTSNQGLSAARSR